MLRFFLLTFLTFVFALQFTGINLWSSAPALAAPILTIEPITWNFVGLDSNNVNVGPNTYVSGARVCNVGSSPALNVQASFIKDGFNNPYINLQGSSTLTVASLPNGPTPPNRYTIDYTPSNCADFYYNVIVTRTPAAYNTTQQFHIEASATNAGVVSTPTPRELYVEKLLSQARNEVLSFTGPSTVYVGDVVQYTVTGKTATAYSQLTFSADFPNIVFQILGVKTSYSNPGAINSTVYADACGWVADPTDPRYHRSATVCDNPDNYPSGGAGGSVTTTYTIKVLSTGGGASGNATVSNLILDFSGGSYHYNADLGSAIDSKTITILQPTPADLSLDKSHTGNFKPGTNSYTLTVTNNGSGTAKGPLTITDTLPTGFTFVSGTGTNWTCSASGQLVTCTNPNDLNVAQSSTITLQVTVDTTASTNSLNTATVSSPTPDPNTANNTDTDPTTILQGADLSLTKTNTPTTFVIGKTGTYTLTVTNSGNLVAAAPITISDTLPTGIGFVSGTSSSGSSGWSCSATGQDVFCTNPNPLAVGSSTGVDLSVTINPNAASSITNTATANSTTYDPNTSNNTATKVTPVSQPVPDLTIVKSHQGTFATGTNNQYTLVVSNVGSESTSGTITVTDTLPSGFTYVSATAAPGSSGWTCSATGTPATVTCTNPGPLLAGASSTILLTVNPSTATTVTNTATVSTPNETNTSNNSSSDPTTVATGSVNLAVSKTITTSPAPTSPGAAIQYQVIITNNSSGNGQDSSIAFRDTVPAAITNVTWSCTFVGTTATDLGAGNPNTDFNSCTNGTAPHQASGSGNSISLNTISLRKGGGQVRFTINGTISSSFLGTLANTATATPSAGVDSSPADNTSTATTTIVGTDLRITKSHSGNFAVGIDSPYTLTVSNISILSTAGIITVTDTLPSGLTYVAAYSAPGSSGWVCSNSGSTVTCSNPGPIAANTSSAITLVVRPTATGSITNTATVTTAGDSNASNNTASDPTSIVAPNADLTITKTAPDGNFQLNQTATYTLTVSNIGTTPAVGPITVTDTLPTGLTFISGTGVGWSCSASGQVVTCTRSSNLDPGSNTTITLATLVGSNTPTAPTQITNTASVSIAADVNTSNNSTSLNKLVNPIADLQITKSHSGNFILGQAAAYQLLVTNNGPSASGSITLNDTLPTGLTFVATGSGGSGFSCSAVGQAVTCTNSTGLLVGQTATITLNVTVGGSTPTGTNSITNTATVTGAVTDPTPANNSSSDPTTVSALQADLAVTKSHTGSFLLGQQGTYTLSVKNNGPAIASGTLTLTDTLPSNLSYVSALGSGWTCSGTTTVTCTNPNASGLAVGSSTAVQITVQVGASTPTGTNSITNTVTVTNATPDPVPGNNTATDPTSVSSGVDLQITKTHGTITAGTTGVYTLTITNNGPDSATSPITVVDYLPIDVTYASYASTSFSCAATASNTVTCTRNTSMAAGATATIDLTVNVGAAVSFPLENIATVSSLSDDSNLANNQVSDIATAPAGSAAEVLLVKRITAIRSGATVTSFTGTVFNPSSTTTDLDDDNPKWPANYLKGGGVSDANPSPADPVDSYNVKPGDQIEYTIYFLNAGGRNAKKLRICDALDNNLTFVPNAYNGLTPTDGGASPDLGMALAIGSTTPTSYLTGANDSPDRGQYFETPTVPAGCNLTTNSNGIVVIDVTRTTGSPTFTDLSFATAAGTPSTSYGFVQFRARVK